MLQREALGDEKAPHINASAPINPSIHVGKYMVSGMTCSACSSRIERILCRIPTVDTVHVNLTSERAYVKFDSSQIDHHTIISAIQKAGYGAFVDDGEQDVRQMEEKKQRYEHLWNRWFLSFVLMSSLMADMYLSMHLHRVLIPTWCGWIMATLVQWLLGIPFYRRALYALRGRTANMDVLVAIASSVSYVYSTLLAISGKGMASFDGAAMVLVMVTFGKLLEMRAKLRVSDLTMHPSNTSRNITAHKLDGSDIENLPAENLLPGDELVVYASELVPTDVTLIQGSAIVDESILTGEAHPVRKHLGDMIYGGSRNLSDVWQGRVARTSDDTMQAHILSMADEAQMERSTTVAWIDRLTAIFVPAVIVIALLTCVVHLWFGASTFAAVQAGVAVLVAACPCALGLATPTALAVGLSVALKKGVVLQNEERLARLRKVDTIVFDKTGTLTTGKLQLIDIRTRSGISSNDLLGLAASVEAGIFHPVARSIVSAAQERGLQFDAGSAAQLVKHGVSKRIDGHVVYVGQATVETATSPMKRVQKDTRANEVPHFRQVDVTSDGVWLGTLSLADEVREETADVMRELAQQGIHLHMLTGDTLVNAASVARTLNIKSVHAELEALDKTKIIQALQQRGHVVAMVGDGVNDAPSLKTADVGIAFGVTSPEAMSSADIAIVSGDLHHILWSMRLATITLNKIRQNLSWAVLYNLLVVPLACLGYLHPMWAGIGMSISSAVVMSNSLMIVRAAR